MFCNNCGATLKDGVKFCSKCGTPVQAQAPVAQPAPAQEPVQAPVAPVAQTAPAQAPVAPVAQPAPAQAPVAPAPQPADLFAQTGQMQQPYMPQMQQPYMPQMQQPKKNKKLPIIIGSVAGAVLVAVIITVCILLFACGGKGADSPQEACEELFTALSEGNFGDLEDIIYPTVFNAEYDPDVYSKDEFVEYVKSKIMDFDAENVKLGSVKIIDKDIYDVSDVQKENYTNKSCEGYIKIEKLISVKGNVKVKIGNADPEDRGFVIKLCYADGKWYVKDGGIKDYAYNN